MTLLYKIYTFVFFWCKADSSMYPLMYINLSQLFSDVNSWENSWYNYPRINFKSAKASNYTLNWNVLVTGRKSRLETLPLTESLSTMQRHVKNAKHYYAVKVDMIKIPMNAQFFYEFKLTINLPPVRFIISVFYDFFNGISF